MSPLELHFLLECYSRPDKRPMHALEASFADSCISSGLMCISAESGPYNQMAYRTTEKGDAWVKSILRTSAPTESLKFIDELGRVIE